jgi:DNA polymerase III sliding clamp (beta) subunit (PCNA family)
MEGNIMKTVAYELKQKYTENELKVLIKLLTPTKEPKTKEEDYIKMLYSVIQKNTIRPILEYVKSTPETLTATDLENTLIIQNKFGLPVGVFNKQHLELKNYPDVMDINDYPIIKPISTSEQSIKVPADILLQSINKALYCVGDADNISVNGLRFVFGGDKMSVYVTDTYRMAYNDYNVPCNQDLQVTVAEKTCKILQTCLKGVKSEVRITKKDNQIQFNWDDKVLLARVIEMEFINVKKLLADIQFTYKAVFDKDTLADILKQVEVVTKTNKKKYKTEYVLSNENIRSKISVTNNINTYNK